MSDQSAHSGATSELDVTVDGLLAAPDMSLAPSSNGTATATAAPPTAPAPVAMAAPLSAPAPASAATLDEEIASDPLLSQIASELEDAKPALAASDDSFAPEQFAAPTAEEIASVAASRLPSPAIAKLDQAIASDADRLLAQAQADLPPEPIAAPRPPAPVAAVAVAPPPPAASAPVAPAPAPAAPAPQPKVVEAAPPPAPKSVEVIVRDAAPALVPAGPGVMAILATRLAAPLRPLAELHERLGESARQTIAYCAILTMFCAACAWGMPRFMRAKELEPVTPGQEFYDDTTPAHGVVAPPRPASESAEKAEHGGGEKEASGGHGEAKKSAKAKPEKKSGHGDAPAEKKSSKKAAKADAHGGGH